MAQKHKRAFRPDSIERVFPAGVAAADVHYAVGSAV